jgi:MEDS: MEthanogen/methylotroph, DcmR Sensory domain
MANDGAAISLAGSRLDQTRHVCAFFNDDDEEYGVLLPFVKDGFACGDKAIHVVNPDQRDSHLRRLEAAGVDAAAARQRGQLDLWHNTDTYLRDGRFDQEQMLGVFEQLAGSAASRGFHRSRIICRMDWARERVFVDHVIEFESRVNDVWRRHDDVVICTYHVSQFSGDAVIDIMRTHPMVIVGGVLHRNPFFVPPEQFVESFRRRREKRAARGRTDV